MVEKPCKSSCQHEYREIFNKGALSSQVIARPEISSQRSDSFREPDVSQSPSWESKVGTRHRAVTLSGEGGEGALGGEGGEGPGGQSRDAVAKKHLPSLAPPTCLPVPS